MSFEMCNHMKTNYPNRQNVKNGLINKTLYRIYRQILELNNVLSTLKCVFAATLELSPSLPVFR